MISMTQYKEASMRLTVLSFLSLVLALTAVSGCGIKPGKLAPPPGVSKDTYPKTYPDPSTDPKPQSKSTQPESAPQP